MHTGDCNRVGLGRRVSAVSSVGCDSVSGNAGSGGGLLEQVYGGGAEVAAGD